jgi:hypothetical protein
MVSEPALCWRKVTASPTRERVWQTGKRDVLRQYIGHQQHAEPRFSHSGVQPIQAISRGLVGAPPEHRVALHPDHQARLPSTTHPHFISREASTEHYVRRTSGSSLSFRALPLTSTAIRPEPLINWHQLSRELHSGPSSSTPHTLLACDITWKRPTVARTRESLTDRNPADVAIAGSRSESSSRLRDLLQLQACQTDALEKVRAFNHFAETREERDFW